MPSSPIVGAFVFPDFWENSFRANSNLARLADCGVNAIMTESDSYELSALDATHKIELRFFAGVASFSDHASNFHALNKRPELWPVLENGSAAHRWSGMSACRRHTADARRRRLRKSSRSRGPTPWTGWQQYGRRQPHGASRTRRQVVLCPTGWASHARRRAPTPKPGGWRRSERVDADQPASKTRVAFRQNTGEIAKHRTPVCR